MGYGNGSNADDGNTNYARGEAASRAIRALLDIAAADGNWSGLVRIKAWHDAGLARDGRPWGNVVNGYGAGAPLSDRGMPRLSRFSGVALLDAWIEGKAELAGMPVLGRIGQQSTTWGERSMTPGGLEALNPRDLPGLHRAAPIANESIVPRPMLFGRIEPGAGHGSSLALEAYYQSAFRPSALDACGTLWLMSDYLVEGCDRVMSGQPLVSDRARTALGVYQKRLPTLTPKAKEFGFGATWRPTKGSSSACTMPAIMRAPRCLACAAPCAPVARRCGPVIRTDATWRFSPSMPKAGASRRRPSRASAPAAASTAKSRTAPRCRSCWRLATCCRLF